MRRSSVIGIIVFSCLLLLETKQTEETVKYTKENTRFLGEEKLNSVERKKIENAIVGILLIEDNAHDAEKTIRALKKNRITNGVSHLKDGVQALDFLFGTGEFAGRDISQKPKVILLDLKMPKADGIEVLAQIKSNEVTKNIPVVVLTSSKENPDIEKCYALGANSCIVKPVDFAGFMQAISHSRLYWVMLNHPPV